MTALSSYPFRRAPNAYRRPFVRTHLGGGGWASRCVNRLLSVTVKPIIVAWARFRDSAGGYLSLMSGITALREGWPTPGAIVAMSRLTDFRPEPKMDAPSAATCSVVPRHAMHGLLEVARRTHAALAHEPALREMTAPVDCELSGLPPTLIQASTAEFVYPDAELMAERLAASGVHCELQLWNGQPHVFQAAHCTREAREAVARIGAFLKQAWRDPHDV